MLPPSFSMLFDVQVCVYCRYSVTKLSCDGRSEPNYLSVFGFPLLLQNSGLSAPRTTTKNQPCSASQEKGLKKPHLRPSKSQIDLPKYAPKWANLTRSSAWWLCTCYVNRTQRTCQLIILVTRRTAGGAQIQNSRFSFVDTSSQWPPIHSQSNCLTSSLQLPHPCFLAVS